MLTPDSGAGARKLHQQLGRIGVARARRDAFPALRRRGQHPGQRLAVRRRIRSASCSISASGSAARRGARCRPAHAYSLP
jgi:hypothetical protein